MVLRALVDAARLGWPAIDAVAERFTLIACHRPQDHDHLVEGAFDVLDATVCTLTPEHPRAARRVTAALRHLREDGPSWPGFRLQ
ncbi:hypothetical protein [Euzebya pacifica]|uniref:hypothetical protein n=1 Tax=Euzebya pacifica TaxID=1608957 RepID=UPI0030F638B4